jgi:hypothetical protein
MSLIGFLIAVVIVLVVLYVTKVIIDYMELPPPIRTVVLLIVGLVCLLVLLNQLGFAGDRIVVF